MQNDIAYMALSTITLNNMDQEIKIKKHFMNNYPWLKEIYHYLQSKSKAYPWLDFYTLREEFTRRLNFASYKVNQAIETIFMTRTTKRSDHDPDHFPANGLSRYMFLESMVRIAVYLYSSEKTSQGSAGEAEYDHVKKDMASAFNHFLTNKLKQYHADLEVKWDEFRKNVVWQQGVEEVFTLNDKGTRDIYSMYSKNNRDYVLKPHNATWMIYEDCEQLFKRDSSFRMPKKVIREAYAMCKMTVVSEHDSKGLQ